MSIAERGTAGTVRSSSWGAVAPDVSVVVSTYNRRAFLPALVASLGAQDLDRSRFEVVIVDNGSSDGAWEALQFAVGDASFALLAARAPVNLGPGGGRNLGLRYARGTLIAFTDDDCLPDPGWVGALAEAADGTTIVQGPVRPAGTRPGPWDRSLDVGGPTAFFETANVAYPRVLLERIGGFDRTDRLTARSGGRHAFGEDALLGWAATQTGARRVFRRDAVVFHRWIPQTYGRFLRSHLDLAGFPGLAFRSPLVAGVLYRRCFLSRRTAAFDAAVISCALAVRRRRLTPLVGSLPWLFLRLPTAVDLAEGGSAAVVTARVAELLVADLVGCLALLAGSFRHRRLIF
jgi:glycosyltransferase involved in cell wall biosynthesis